MRAACGRYASWGQCSPPTTQHSQHEGPQAEQLEVEEEEGGDLDHVDRPVEDGVAEGLHLVVVEQLHSHLEVSCGRDASGTNVYCNEASSPTGTYASYSCPPHANS